MLQSCPTSHFRWRDICWRTVVRGENFVTGCGAQLDAPLGLIRWDNKLGNFEMNLCFSLKRGTSHRCLMWLSQRSERVRYYKQMTIGIKFQYKHILTYLLTPWSTVPLEKLVLQLVKKFPAFYGTRKFITVFTSARKLSLSWANSIQSPQPPPTSCRSILILSSHLRLGLPNGPSINIHKLNTLLKKLQCSKYSK